MRDREMEKESAVIKCRPIPRGGEGGVLAVAWPSFIPARTREGSCRVGSQEPGARSQEPGARSQELGAHICIATADGAVVVFVKEQLEPEDRTPVFRWPITKGS